jgi:hypothetical protein
LRDLNGSPQDFRHAPRLRGAAAGMVRWVAIEDLGKVPKAAFGEAG